MRGFIMGKSLHLWQLFGFSIVGVFGTLLHFLYDWTDGNRIVGLFSAVNESIWEHMKLLFFPMIIFAAIESFYFGNDYDNFWCSKLFGILIGLITIPILYYSYTGVLGASADWFNILIFFISAALTFYIETKIISSSFVCPLSPAVSKIILTIIGILFIVFTFIPPQIPLFEDPLTNTFGINKKGRP